MTDMSPVDDFDTMPAYEMMARREAAEQETALLIGQFLFAYSRFVTATHLAVAWLGGGAALDAHRERARGYSVSDLLKALRARANAQLASGSDDLSRYTSWCDRADVLRATRNDIAHARWGMEAYGRHAIAVTTPVLVDPPEQREFTAAQLRDLCEECSGLANELSTLRRSFPL